MTNFEQPSDASVAAVAGGVAAAARSVLSDEFVKSGQNPVTGDSKPADSAAKLGESAVTGVAEALGQKAADSSSPAVKAGEGIASGVADAVAKQKPSDSSPSLGNLLKDALKNGIDNGARSESPNIGDKVKMHDGMNDIVKYLDKNVTDKNRNEAKEALGNGLSELIPEADKALLKTMQGALIDGNLDKLKGSLGSLSGDPERMEKFLKEINGQLKREGAGVELTSDGKGNVLVYEKHGNTAVSINAKTGETTLRAIERQNDGSVLLKPGEIINRKPGEVMKNIGDEATRNITGMNYRFHKYEYLDQLQTPRQGGSDSHYKNVVPGTIKSLENMNPGKAIKGIENLIPEVKKKQN